MKLKPTSKRYTLLGLCLFALLAGGICLFSGKCRLLTPDQLGYRLFSMGQFKEASGHFADPMWQGAALYREGMFKEAAGVYAGFDTPEAAFNHGNSLAMLGKYQEAVARYDRALELQPGWEDAVINREIAHGRAEMMKNEGGNMTGGKMGADEIVFDKTKSSPEDGTEETDGGQQLSDTELREVWLRQVQTKPADFLRSKFAYQQQMGSKPSTETR
ncbi:MAG: tetratricopeptide repeat protein [Thermodesulfobacteriota bacterium]